jgi:hypothetical protein
VKPLVTAFFDEATFTVSYVVKDPSSKSAAIIDSVWTAIRSQAARAQVADRIVGMPRQD